MVVACPEKVKNDLIWEFGLGGFRECRTVNLVLHNEWESASQTRGWEARTLWTGTTTSGKAQRHEMPGAFRWTTTSSARPEDRLERGGYRGEVGGWQESQVHHSVALRSWMNYLRSLRLSFFFCLKIGTTDNSSYGPCSIASLWAKWDQQTDNLARCLAPRESSERGRFDCSLPLNC